MLDPQAAAVPTAPCENAPTFLIVPGLRDHAPTHWQTLLEADLQRAHRKVHSVPPLGKAHLGCQARVDGINQALAFISGPVILVAHSGACISVAHWVRQHALDGAGPVVGALLAVPPDFDAPLPEGYPTPQELAEGGWFPVPRAPLPFHSLVALSRNDPLGSYARTAALACDWGSDTVDLGEVGHLNPASGFGPWPGALPLIARVQAAATARP